MKQLLPWNLSQGRHPAQQFLVDLLWRIILHKSSNGQHIVPGCARLPALLLYAVDALGIGHDDAGGTALQEAALCSLLPMHHIVVSASKVKNEAALYHTCGQWPTPLRSTFSALGYNFCILSALWGLIQGSSAPQSRSTGCKHQGQSGH